jgi:alanyl-tRNA synthetase
MPSRIFGRSEAQSGAPIPYLAAAEVRRRFVDFFGQRGHIVVPSASLVPPGDPTLLFVNSGMVQFKDVLTGQETRSYKRAVDYQRCLRVAGKHNDFEEVGRTTRHHTFFEMLGNWSFGDYFKRDAIKWAVELLTGPYGIPFAQLGATTYKDDEESREIWRSVGMPEKRMAVWGDVDAGDEHNFWRMADTGPCGPCSEIHFDRGAQFSEGPHCVPDHSETCPRWLEIWNLVFMEFDQLADGRRVPLPFKSVDTGMGLERLTSAIQGVSSNYDTDLFTPIHEAMRAIVGHDPEQFEQERFSYQVIADHARAVTFLVADDVRPGNEGRGYVLRRIIRRAVRHGRLLGRTKPFLGDLSGAVVDTMVGAYPYLAERREMIASVITREERLFARTLDSGTLHLMEALIPLGKAEREVGRQADTLPADAPVLPGEVAFRLHDTYGFPIDLTVELAAEYGARVDRPGFDAALAVQRERSRRDRAGKRDRSGAAEALAALPATAFLGYEFNQARAQVLRIVRDGVEYDELAAVPEAELRAPAGARAEVVLDQTPFYAEGGGQVGDAGVLHDADGGVVFEVEDTQLIGRVIVHYGTLRGRLHVGDKVDAEVDPVRRKRIMRNHTATHLLHRALRNVIGEQARQAGSLVTPDYLRFDYPADRALTSEERRAIEAEVRAVVRDNPTVEPRYMSMADAQAAGADAFFDEKYGERVRVVFVGDYSRELCGGTHCSFAGQIGSFVISGERSIGAGMRRIEALTGDAADALISQRLALLDQVVEQLRAPSLEAVPGRIAELQARARGTRREAARPGPRPADLVKAATSVAGTRLVAYAAEFASMKELQGFAKDVRAALGAGVIALGLDADQPQLFVTVSDDLVERGVSAADLIAAAAPSIGGRGGGRPQMAQARGDQRAGIGQALAAVADQLRGAAKR